MVDVLQKKDFFAPDGFPIAIARREPQPLFPQHAHQFCELVIVTEGRGLHLLRGASYPVTVGDVFVISRNAPHEYRNMDRLGLINIMYSPEDLVMDDWDVLALPGYHAMFKLEPTYRRRHQFESRLRLGTAGMTMTRKLTDQLEAELVNRHPGFRLMCRGVFMQLVAFLARCYEQSTEPASRELLKIGEAITYLEAHFQDDVSIDQLAGMAAMSRRTFTRMFRKLMGRSAVEHLTQLRIAHAADLLRTTTRSITDIAFAAGFSDGNYFSRQFRQLHGCSPRDFRGGQKRQGGIHHG